MGPLFESCWAKGRRHLDAAKLRDLLRRKIYKDLDMDVYPPRPHRIMESVNKYFPDAVKVCDIGKNKYYSGLLLHASEPNSVLFSNMQSAMGFTSGAIGATFATNKRVVVITGDGGFMMNPQEIATAVRYNKQLVVIVINDNGLGLVRAKQIEEHNQKYAVDFPNPDFVKYADAFGVKGYSVNSWGHFDRVMREVAASDEYAIVEVPVDYSEGI